MIFVALLMIIGVCGGLGAWIGYLIEHIQHVQHVVDQAAYIGYAVGTAISVVLGVTAAVQN